MRMRRCITVGLGLLLPALAQSQASFPVSFASSATALSSQQRAEITLHVQVAGQRWARELQLGGARSIEIEIALNPAVTTANGASLTSAFIGTQGGINVFEQGVAAELRTGNDPNGSEPDARFTFGTSYLANELWFDPDPNTRSATVPNDRTDAFSVILHEFGHAIAYNGFADGNGVPNPGFFSAFDRWFISGTPPLFDGPVSVQVWGSRPDLTQNNVFHWGNGAGFPAKWSPAAQPVTWRDGVPLPGIACSGIVSINAPPSADRQTAKGLPSLIDQLMNGVVFFRGSRYDVGALDLAVLSDVGLSLAPAPTGFFADGFEGPP